MAEMNDQFEIEELNSLEEFSKLLSPPYSWTWTGGVMPSSRKTKNWQSQQVFGLDFDTGILPEVVISRCEKVKLIPNILYHTFSDTPELRKFRLVFILTTSITEPEGAKNFIKYLLEIFPEADKRCKDLSRMFLGGKESRILNNRLHSTKDIYQRTDIHHLANGKGNYRKINRSLEAREKQGAKPKSYHIPPDEIALEQFMINKNFENPDWRGLESKVKILADFINGEWLGHNEIFGLATNLHWFKGGMKFMKDIMLVHNQAGKTNYTQNNLQAIPYCNKMKYFPESLSSFSKYPEDHQLGDITKLARRKKGFIKTLFTPQKISIEEAELKQKEFIQKFMSNESGPGIYILKTHTGLGKSKELTALSDVLIACPTNALKDELSAQMIGETSTSMEIPQFQNHSLNEELRKKYDRGDFQGATITLRDIASNKKDKYHISDCELAKKYLNSNKLLRSNTKDNILTTHERALSGKSSKEIIIFDEDPLDSILKIGSFTLDDLTNYKCSKKNTHSPGSGILQIISQAFNNCKQGEVKKTPCMDVPWTLEGEDPNLYNVDISNNISGFMHSDFYTKDMRNGSKIHYLTKRNLPLNKKVLICSATIDVPLYQKLFGKENIKSVETLIHIKKKGKVIQDSTRAYSRSSMPGGIEKVQEFTKGMKIITFKKYDPILNDPPLGIYFGNCSGYNNLKGENIAVVGTPHSNPSTYLLTAKAMGIELEKLNLEFTDQLVKRNGFEFMFKTFEDQRLQDIQMHFIERELLQAVGRARALRENCTVYVFSNYPLPITDAPSLNYN
ncbi:MAG: hypothetical protein ACQEW9_17700 [Bacteroidota bacterium]